jgi:hypothetical protein
VYVGTPPILKTSSSRSVWASANIKTDRLRVVEDRSRAGEPAHAARDLGRVGRRPEGDDPQTGRSPAESRRLWKNLPEALSGNAPGAAAAIGSDACRRAGAARPRAGATG